MAKPEQSLEHIANALQAIAKELTTIRRLLERGARQDAGATAQGAEEPGQEDSTDGI
jgi:hypothetical protein